MRYVTHKHGTQSRPSGERSGERQRQRERRGDEIWRSSFEKLPSACTRRVGVTTSHADAHKCLAESYVDGTAHVRTWVTQERGMDGNWVKEETISAQHTLDVQSTTGAFLNQ